MKQIPWTTIGLIRAAVERHALDEQNWCDVQDSQWLRAWYTFKVIICILLNRRTPRLFSGSKYTDDPVEVAIFNSHSYTDWEFGRAYSFDVLSVGHGFFTDWYYTIKTDGAP